MKEQKVSTVSDAAALANEYILTHRDTFEWPHLYAECGTPAAKPFAFPMKSHLQGEVKVPSKESADTKDRPIYFYCKKRGHTISQCFALEKQNKSPKAVNLLKTETWSEALVWSSWACLYTLFIWTLGWGRACNGLVSPQFPISGVPFILGNNLAGGKVLINSEVAAVPLSGHSDDLDQRFPRGIRLRCHSGDGDETEEMFARWGRRGGGG